MDKQFHKDFLTCPGMKEDGTRCGSTNRFFESMAKEVKDRGVARPEWTFYLDIKQGVVMDKTREATIPIGSEVPAYTFATDICLDCGNIYAVFIDRSNATKSIEQIKSMPGPTIHGN